MAKLSPEPEDERIHFLETAHYTLVSKGPLALTQAERIEIAIALLRRFSPEDVESFKRAIQHTGECKCEDCKKWRSPLTPEELQNV